MMIEKKAKDKGKAIIGIAMAAIMLASMLVAMVPMGSARDPANGNIQDGDTLFAGEHGLSFDTVALPNIVRLEGRVGAATEGEIIVIADPTNFYIPVYAVEGVYDIIDVTGGDIGNIVIKKPSITGNVYLAGTIDSIVGKSIPVGTRIIIRACPNFGGLLREAGTGNWGKIKIKLIDPDGIQYVKKIDADAPEIDITPDDWDQLDTSGWDVGTWKVRIVSDKATCNEVDVSSPEYEFTVRSEELSIDAVEEAVFKGEDIVLTVTGNPKAYYYLTVTNVDETASPEIKYAGDVKALSGPAVISAMAPNLAAWIQTGSDGIADVRIDTTGADDRTYTVKVYDTTAVLNPAQPGGPTFAPDAIVAASALTTGDDDIDVKVVKATVTFDIPASVVIGEEVTIRGTVSAGDSVDILIDDGKVPDFWDDEPVDEDKEFEVKWDTSGYTTGSYTIDVYIDCAVTAATAQALYAAIQVAGIDEDGKTTIRLVVPGLAAKQPRNVVAEGDDYAIEGRATGVDDVDIVLVGPRGYPPSDPGLSVLNGLEIMSSSVTDNEFSEDIEMTVGLDLGTWKTMVFSPGRDGVYGRTWLPAGALDCIGTAVFVGKTQSQIVAILKDFTVDVVGSDDLLVELTFKVESPYVRLNPIESVEVGEPLNVSGVTNREQGTIIVISTFAGPTYLPAVITEVEWPTQDQGIFNATIDTTYAVVGTYTLQADDGDGHTDTATVEILPPKPSAPEVSVFTDKKEYSPGDVMKANIRISNPTDDTQALSFEWYLGISEYDLWAEMAAMPVNLHAGYDQTFTASIPVGDWGKESFCGCHIVSLTDTETKKVVSVDSTTWIYMPGALPESKTSVEIAKEITKEIEGVELQLPS